MLLEKRIQDRKQVRRLRQFSRQYRSLERAYLLEHLGTPSVRHSQRHATYASEQTTSEDEDEDEDRFQEGFWRLKRTL